jgi:hypothetical protein
MSDERDRPASPGDRVGLGRVVANPSGLGHGEPATQEGPLVEEASEDSFPASDPPGFTTGPATPAERDEDDLPGTELPDREPRA